MNSGHTPKTVFLGTPIFAAIILQELLASKTVDISFVVTRPDKPAGRNKKIVSTEVNKTAQEFGKSVVFDASMDEVIDKISLTKPDLMIVTAYGKIIPEKLLSIPKYGCINVHPSLLPKYRGPSPIQAAIIAADKETGITLIKMNEKMDEGDIIASKKGEIKPSDTAGSLTLKLAEIGAQLLIQTIPLYIKGQIKPIKQDLHKATYCRLIKKEHGKINWSEDSSMIERKIRAFYPWPTAWTLWKEKIVKLIPGNRIQLEGKKVMKIEDFLRGHPDFTLPRPLSW